MIFDVHCIKLTENDHHNRVLSHLGLISQEDMLVKQRKSDVCWKKKKEPIHNQSFH